MRETHVSNHNSGSDSAFPTEVGRPPGKLEIGKIKKEDRRKESRVVKMKLHEKPLTSQKMNSVKN